MQPWLSPEVPKLPGGVAAVSVFDSSTQSLVATLNGLDAHEPARLYVCGITPYDATHIGHAATYVAFDLLIRLWLDSGREVLYTQNVTDVDDPLLERADRDGIDWRKLAESQIDLFRTDMDALRVVPPTDYIGAVESIPLVIDLIEELRQRGAVYSVDDDLYFDVTSDPLFGAVSGFEEAQMQVLFAERGGDPERAGKRHPLDSVLWLAARPGEPSWPSPFGEGRPGWHVECTAIALQTLGAGFDVQGGGSDLVFPHHEMCASAAQVVSAPVKFAQAYVHTGMVALEGEKMSKSRGNLVFVSRLRDEGVDPMLIRLALLSHHYRHDWEWTDSDIPTAANRLSLWRSAAELAPGPVSGGLLEQVRTALANDLDAPAALAAVDAWAHSTLSTASNLTMSPLAAGSADLDASTQQPMVAGSADTNVVVAVADIVDALLGVSLS